MVFTQKFLARSVVIILLLGLLPALQQQPTAAQDTATYTATKYDCAPGYDPASGDANAAFSNCSTPAAGVSFTLQSGDPSYAGGTQQTNGGGSVSWSGIPLGTGYSISESVPTGYGTPWVYCEVSGDPNNPGNVQPSFFAANGGNMDVGYSAPALTAYTQATCYWFNTPPAQNGQTQQYGGGGTAVVWIQKFLCEDPSYDYDAFAINDYRNNCPDYHNGVGFSINGGTPSSTGNNNGTVQFESLAAGTADIRVHESQGYRPQAVYCVAYQNGSNQPNLDETHKQTLTDEGNGVYRLSPTLQDGYTYYCSWYNYKETHANVYVYKYYCEPDYDWGSGGYNDLFTGCTSAHSNVYFEVHNGNYSEGMTTNGSGTASWAGVPSGTLEIVEQVPDGYQVGRVFCGVAQQNDATQPTTWTEYTYSDGWNVDLPDGQYLHCYVFDIPSDYGTIYLYKYYCDPTFDWQSNGYDYLLSGCTNPHSNVYFEVQNGGYSEGQTTDGSGTAAWSNVPTGSLDISEQSPDGYVVGRVFCGYSSDGSTLPTSWDEYTYNQGIQVELPGGQYLFCVYFNVPSDYGTIYFYKYYCAPDFDWQSNGYDYLLSGCTTPHQNVYFETYSDNYSQGQTTDSTGAATWTDVPWGSLSFYEEVPEGYQVGRIFCGYSETEGTPPTSWDEYTYADGWDVPTPPGKYLYCYIFDVPYDNGTVYLYKYYCAPDFDWQSNGYEYLLSGCATPHENVYFETYSDNYSQGQTTDSTGAATWTDVPWGNLSFYEEVPTGYQVGRIFCGYSEQDGTQPTSWDEYSYSGGWDVPTPPGKYLYCYVFDVPSSYGTVYLYKYYCQPEFDWETGGFEYLLSGCNTPQSDVYFETHNGNYSQGQTTDSAGMATWTDVPWGNLEITEQAPDGYKVGAIYCGYSDQQGTQPSSWTEGTYSGGLNVELPEGQYLYCYIFDVPYDYGTIYFYKYYCAPDFDWQSNGYEYLLSGCATPHENVYFETYSDNYSQGQTTDSTGAATWTDVPWGSLSFYEEVPEGYQVGRIFCGYSETEGTPPTSWDEYNYADGWDVPTPPGKYLYCYIFDVPYDYGTIYLYKYYCAPDFDWSSGGYDYLYGACTSPHADVYFEVNNNGYSQGQTTDSAGAATWADVPSGNLQITEQVPDGYKVGRIFCGYSSQDGVPPTSWDEYDYFDGYNVSIAEGQYLYCYIFDVPYTYGTVYIYKYYCAPEYNWQSSGYDDFYANCTSPQSDVYFEIEASDYINGQTTDSSGTATWADVPIGFLSIYEQPPSGYQVGKVFCGVIAQNSGTLPTSWDEYDYTDRWNVDLPEGQYLHCFVFNVPSEYGWVTIWKYTCPQDFDYASSEQSYYESSCTERPHGVEFELYNDPYGYQENQSTDSSGEASWSDVPSGGSLYMWEVPNGYQPIAVYCGVSSDGSEPSVWDPYTLDSDGGLSGVWVDPNAYLICKWFNKPYDNPQVWIYKYNCDQTAQWSWAYHQLLSHCTTPAPNVEFGFGAQGSAPSLSTTDAQGKWLYENLEPGVWYWEESYPTGYSGAVVYCQWVGGYGSGDYQKASLDGSTLWLDVEHGDVVTCYWFDFPTGYEPPTSGGSSGSGSSGGSSGSGTSSGGTSGSGTSGGTGTAGGSGGTGGPPPLTSNVPTGTGTGPKTGGPTGGSTTQTGSSNAPATLIIVKRTCPEGFDLYGKDADVEKDCKDLTSGIDFGLTDLGTPDSEPVDQTTGDDGKATWTNLKAGPYLIVESLPEDTYAAFIWTCKSDKRQFQLQYPFTPFSYAGPNGEIGITLIGGEKLECAWYDVPTAPGEVTILKFECPGSPVIVAQCSPAGAGVAFALTPAGGVVGAIVQLTTDDSGTATGSGAAGAYNLAEEGGSPCLIDSDSMNDQGQVVLALGTPAEVKVYNCGGNGS